MAELRYGTEVERATLSATAAARERDAREREAAQEVAAEEARAGAARQAAVVSAEETWRHVADVLGKAVAAAAEDADAAGGSSRLARKTLL